MMIGDRAAQTQPRQNGLDVGSPREAGGAGRTAGPHTAAAALKSFSQKTSVGGAVFVVL